MLSGEIALKNNNYYYYYHYHSFSFASSSVWNSILNDVRCAPSLSSSKSRSKTYLFHSAYKDLTLSLITVHMCMAWPCHSFVDGLS